MILENIIISKIKVVYNVQMGHIHYQMNQYAKIVLKILIAKVIINKKILLLIIYLIFKGGQNMILKNKFWRNNI